MNGSSVGIDISWFARPGSKDKRLKLRQPCSPICCEGNCALTSGTFGLPTSLNEYADNFAQQPLPSLSSEVYRLSRYLEEAKAVRDRVECDPRLKNYIEPFNTGESREIRLQVNNLVCWWVWRANSTSIATADSDLESFIASIEKKQERICALWVYGITSATTVNLSNDIQLIPISDMPLSGEKLRFQRLEMGIGFNSRPVAAITAPVTYSFANRTESAKQESEANHGLLQIAAILNCIEGCICIPAFSSTYAPDHLPPGYFGGGGGQYWTEQSVPNALFDLSQGDKLGEIKHMIQSFTSLPEKYQQQFQSALERFAQAKCTGDNRKRSLELGISLEMLLTYGENKKDIPDQLSLSFRTRGAWIAGRDLEDRKYIYKILNDIYSHRSQVAHLGDVDYKNLTLGEIATLKKEQISVAERIFQSLIALEKPPIWKDFILGGATQSLGHVDNMSELRRIEALSIKTKKLQAALS